MAHLALTNNDAQTFTVLNKSITVKSRSLEAYGTGAKFRVIRNST